MSSRIFGIHIINSNHILQEVTTLNKNTYRYGCLPELRDYVREMDFEESRIEFEEHLKCNYPHVYFAEQEGIKVYKIPVEDLQNFLEVAWKYSNNLMQTFTKEDFFNWSSGERCALIASLRGEGGRIRYATFNIDPEDQETRFDYPQSTLQNVRYLYYSALQHNQKEICVQFVGALDDYT